MSNVIAAVRFAECAPSFGDVHAIDDVSFEIADGEFFSLLGPSGSGKTTCLRLIAGFEQPDAGAIAIHGVNVAGVPPYERNVNTVFQDYALFPHMTVGENVEYGLMIRKVPAAERRARSDEMLELVKLAGLRRSKARAALRRAASAGGAGARADQPAARAAARRAARRAGSQAARADAGRAEGAAAPGRHHLRVRDPRPGRGPVDERPPGGLQPRAHRADRHARRRSTRTPRRPSSPGSSASPTSATASWLGG